MAKTYIKIDDQRMAESYTVEHEINIESLLLERDQYFTRLKQIDELIVMARNLNVTAARDASTVPEIIVKDGKLEPRVKEIAGDGVGKD